MSRLDFAGQRRGFGLSEARRAVRAAVRPALRVGLALVALLGASAAPAPAATLTWGTSGTGGAGTWNSSLSNWWNGSAQVWNSTTPDAAVFQGTAATVDIQSSITAASVKATVTGYTLNSTNSSTLTTGTIDISSLGLNGDLTVGVKLTGANALTLASAGNQSSTGGIGGSAAAKGINLTNTSNDFVGDVTITTGLVTYANNSVFGNAANQIILTGGGLLDNGSNVALSRAIVVQSGTSTFRTYGSSNASWSSTMSGAGTVNRTDSGALTLTGTLSGFTGTFDNQGGNTVLSGAAPGLGSGAQLKVSAYTVTLAAGRLGSGTAVMNSGTLQWAAGNTDDLSGQLALVNGNTARLDTGTGTVTFANAFGNTTAGAASTAPVWKYGSGTLVLSGSNTFTGGFQIEAGTAQAATIIDGAPSNLGAGTVVGLTNGTLRYTGTSVSTTRWLYFDRGTATIEVTNPATTLTWNPAGGDRTYSLTKTGSGTFVLGGAISGAGTGVTVNSGTLVLNAGSSYAGTTTVNGGVLKIGSSTALGTGKTAVTSVVVNAGGAVDFNGVADATYGYTISGSGASGAGALVNSGSAIGLGTAQTTNIRLAADASIGGSGNWALLASGYGATTLNLNGFTLTKTGANQITLVNTTIQNTGTISIVQGTFALDRNAVSGTGAAVVLANTSGATLALNYNNLTIGSLAGGGASGGNVMLYSATLTVGALNTNTTYSGNISGTGGGLTKNGTGTLTLAASNSFTGVVTVNSGTIKFGNPNSLGAYDTSVGKVVINAGGAVDLNGTIDPMYGYTISGSGADGSGALVNTGSAVDLNKRQTSNIRLAANASIGGTGDFALLTQGYAATTLDLNGFTLTKTGANTFTLVNTTIQNSGTISIAQGTFALYNNDVTGTGATFALANASGVTLDLGSRNLTIGALSGGGATGGNVALGSATLTTGGLNTSTTVSGSIGGTGNLLKVGTGTMALGGVSGYTGSTTIRAGALVANASSPSGAAGAFGNASGAIVVGDGSTGVSDAPSVFVGGAVNVARPISIGSVSNANAYTPVLGGTNTVGTGTFSGAITLATTAAAYTGVVLQAAPGGTVEFTGAWTTNNKAVTIGSAGSTGTVRLSSALATTAGVTVSTGTLQIGGASALGSTTPVTMGNATLDMNGLAATIGTLSGSGTITGAAGSVLTVTQATTGSFGGVLAGSAGLTKAGTGTYTLAGLSTTTGTVTASAGVLALASGASIASANVTVAGAATLAGTGTSGATTVLTGGTLAPGASGVGTLTLSALTFGTAAGNTATVSIPTTGSTSIPATLQVNGNLAANGGAGSVTFAFGSLSLVPTGTYSLISYTGSYASGTTPFKYTGDLSGRQGVSFANGTNTLDLVISNAFPIWSGTDGNGWNTANNWKLNTDNQPTNFLAGDTVVFNDTGSTGTVTITGSSVSPTTTTFSNNTLAYTLDSTGGLGIAAGNFFKTGSGTATIANTNTFGGGSTISGGSLVLTGSAGLGTGGVTVSGGRLAVTGTGRLGGNAVSLTSGTIEVGNDAALGSGTFSLSGGVLSSDSATARTVANSIAVGGPITLGSAVNTGGLTLSGLLDLGGASQTLTTLSNITLSGSVTNGSLVKSGAGALAITGSNAYSGGTNLTAGTLRVGNNAALGTGALTLTSGTLSSDSATARSLANAVSMASDAALGDATNNGQLTLSGTVNLGAATRQLSTLSNVTISGPVINGGLTKAGTSALTLTSSNAYSGGTTLAAGTLRIGNNAALGSGTLALNGGALSSDSTTARTLSVPTTVGGAVTLGDATNNGALTLSGAMNLGGSTQQLTIASPVTISGMISNGALMKAGPGTLTLSTSNAYAGTTTINSGTVVIGNRWAFGPQQNGRPVTQVVVNAGGAVELNGIVDAVYGYTISGSGPTGAGAIVNNGAEITTFIAQTTNIKLGANASIGGTSNWALLTFGYAATTLDLNGFTLTKTGPNTFSLVNTTITNSGTFVVASGTVALASGYGSTGTGAAFVLADAANVGLDLNNLNLTIGALSGGGASGGNVSLGNGILSVGSLNTTTTYAGVISGGGGVAKNGTGTFTLTGANTFTGGISSNGGGVLEATTIADGSPSSIGAGTGGAGYVGISGTSTFRYTGATNATTARTLWMDTGTGASVIDVQNAAATLTWNPGGGTRNKDFAKAGAGTLALGGVISGTANVSVTAGSLELSAVNTYTGNTTIASGSLHLSGSGQLGSGAYSGAISNAGTLAVATSANQTFSGVISGVGSIAKTGAGMLTLSNAANSFSGGVAISAGLVAVGANGALGSGTVSLTGGGLSSDGGTARSLANALAIAGDVTLGNASNTGALSFSNGVDLGGATRQLTTPSNVTFAGSVTNGGLTKTGAGTLTLSASNSYNGGTTLNQGTIAFTSGGLGSSGTVALANATTLQWTAGNTQDISSRLTLPASGGVTLDVGSNNVTLGSGFGAGSSAGLTKAGAGSLTLSGSNGYGGATTVSTGTLALAGAGSIASSPQVNIASGAALDISAATTALVNVGALTNSGSVALGSKTLRSVVAAGNTPFDGVIGGSGGFTKAGNGTLTLTTLQDFMGTARVEAGTLAYGLLDEGGDKLLQSANAIYVASGATLDVSTYNLTVVGGQTLGGYGTVLGNVAFEADSILSPGGSVGSFTTTGSVAYNGPMTYVFDVNDAGGTAGGPNGWDLYTANSFSFSGFDTDTNRFVVDITSLTGTAAGNAANFDPSSNYAWKFLVSGTANPIAVNNGWFTVSTTHFSNSLGDNPGTFYVARGDQLGPVGASGGTNELFVVYAAVPEPGTLALAGIGLGGLACAAARARRRRPDGA